MITVNQGSTAFFDVLCLGPDGDAAIPDTLRWRLVTAQGQEVLPWAELAPAASVRIAIPAEANLQVLGNHYRYITIEATYGGDDIMTEELRYMITDLRGIYAAP